jgi:hypothetical protein
MTGFDGRQARMVLAVALASFVSACSGSGPLAPSDGPGVVSSTGVPFEGTVVSVDPATRTFTTDDGSVVHVPDDFSIDGDGDLDTFEALVEAWSSGATVRVEGRTTGEGSLEASELEFEVEEAEGGQDPADPKDEAEDDDVDEDEDDDLADDEGEDEDDDADDEEDEGEDADADDEGDEGEDADDDADDEGEDDDADDEGEDEGEDDDADDEGDDEDADDEGDDEDDEGEDDGDEGEDGD